MRTGYALGFVTAKRDGHPSMCSVNYDLVRVVDAGPTLLIPAQIRVLDCHLPDGHEGDHWDSSWELDWRSESVDRGAWDAA